MKKPEKLIFDSVTHRGVAWGRDPGPGEYLVELPEQQIAWFRAWPTRYRYVGGNLEEFPELQTEQAEAERLSAFEALKARIIAVRQGKNAANFQYQGVWYVSDEPTILGVKARIIGLPDVDPIPTFTGTALSSTWATAEDTFTPFTCGEFRAFADHYYNHREKNFTNYTMLTIAATQTYQAGATVQELDAFDISQGWD